MKKSLLFITFILLGIIAKAQLISPELIVEQSSATRSSLFARVTYAGVSPVPTGFELEYDGGGLLRNIMLGAGVVFNQPIVGLSPGTAYNIRVRAKYGADNGPWSVVLLRRTVVDFPPAPVLNSTYNCPTNVGLSWAINQRPGEIEEQIVQRSFDNATWVTIGNLFPTERFYNDGDARPGRTTWYRVVTRNISGLTNSNSVMVSVIPFTGPKNPVNVRSDQTNKSRNHLTIRWENPADDVACGSDIRASNFLMVKLFNETEYKLYAELYPNANTARIDGLKPKDVVDFRVFSLSNKGLQSNWIGGRDTTWGPPYAPSNMIIVAFKDRLNVSSLEVRWKDNSKDEDYFQIEVSTDSTNFNLLAKIKFDNTNFYHTPVEEGVNYFYRMKAGSNTDGESAYTPVSFGVNFPYSAKPNAPYGLQGALVANRINLKWYDDSDKERNYILERSIDNTTSFKILSTLPRNSTTFVDSDVSTGKTYNYRIRAVNPLGESDNSNVATIRFGTTLVALQNVELSFYPNPTSDFLQVKVPESIVGKSGSVMVYDENNRIVLEKKFNNFSDEFSIPATNLISGKYNVKLTSKDFVQTKKIYKH